MQPLEALMGGGLRTRLVSWALDHDEAESESSLARQFGVTPRAVRLALEPLEAAGLFGRRREGRRDSVVVCRAHPAWKALSALAQCQPSRDDELRAEVAAAGAPLPVDRPAARKVSVEETLVDSVELARRDPTVLRALPVVVSRHADHLDWDALIKLAKARRRSQEVGMLVSLTAELTGRPWLEQRVEGLKDRRHKRLRPFLERPMTRRERRLADARTPAAARRWNFVLNMDEEAFRSTLRRHATA